ESHVRGDAKGQAMIGPNLARMLAVVLSGAAVGPAELATLAQRTTARSFNCISVEGHTSTADTVLFFANGAGPRLAGDALARFEDAAAGVCAELAQAIAADAEGASHLTPLSVQ